MPDLDRLAASEVRATVGRLEERITARFPGRGIAQVAARLGTLVDDVAGDAPDINRRLRLARVVSRVGAAVVLAATLVAVGLALRDTLDDGVRRSIDWLPLVETTINDLVYAAIALFFLYSIPDRLQRGRSLTLLHRLRSLAHVVDMHQLTKDPERVVRSGPNTPSSPIDTMSPFELNRYLDYCSEMLSLISKAAALHVQGFDDTVTLDAVEQIEDLTNGLSRKIWQKIMILDRMIAPAQG